MTEQTKEIINKIKRNLFDFKLSNDITPRYQEIESDVNLLSEILETDALTKNFIIAKLESDLAIEKIKFSAYATLYKMYTGDKELEINLKQQIFISNNITEEICRQLTELKK